MSLDPEIAREWAPLTVEEARSFSAMRPSVGIAGGWTVDLFAGRTTRSHDDVEVTVVRAEPPAL